MSRLTWKKQAKKAKQAENTGKLCIRRMNSFAFFLSFFLFSLHPGVLLTVAVLRSTVRGTKYVEISLRDQTFQVIK